MSDQNNEIEQIINNDQQENNNNNQQGDNNNVNNNQQGNNNNNRQNFEQVEQAIQQIVNKLKQFEQAINIINNNNNANLQNQQQQGDIQNQVVRELQNVEAQQQQQINQIRETPKTYSNKNKKDCEIGTIFKIFEAKNKHTGNIKDVCRRLIDHFNDEALSTFMSKYDDFNNYNEIKTYMINCFDHRAVFSPEDELNNIKDTNFKRFGEFLLKFERIKNECTNISEKRSIELFINSISNKEIRKSIYTRNVKKLDEAFQEAKQIAIYEFKENGRQYYSPLSDDNNNNNNELTNKGLEPMEINAITNSSNNKNNRYYKKKFNNNYNKNENNKNNNNENEKKNIKCYNCGQLGHYKNQCKLKVMVINPPIENLNSINDNTTKVSVAGVFKINKNLTKCLIDTGAAITLINYEFCKYLNLQILNKPTSCKVANFSNLQIIGTTELEIFFGKPHKITQVYVSKDLPYNCLIGYETLKTMNAVIDTVDDTLFYKHNPKHSINLLPSCNINLVGQSQINQINDPITNNNENNKSETNKNNNIQNNNNKNENQNNNNQLKETINYISPIPQILINDLNKMEFESNETKTMTVQLVQKYQRIFQDKLNVTDDNCIKNVVHEIHLSTNDVKYQGYPVKYSKEELEFLINHIKELEHHGIIKESNSPVSSSIVMRKKPDNSWRMCINYVKLNAITIKDKHPLPDVELLWPQLRGKTVFSKIDMVQAYYQIKLRESDRWLTAFRSPTGFYEFVRLPFGLCNAPATFQRAVNTVLKDLLLKSVYPFLDDIFCYSNTTNNHQQELEEILVRMDKHNMVARLIKCQFFKSSVKYVGHVISKDGVQIDYSRLDPLYNLINPSNKKELQRILGVINYFRKYIPNLAKKLNSIYRLLKDDVNYEWNINHTNTLKSIIDKLKNDKIVLVYPNYNELFIIETDASDLGIGAVIKQKHGIISFYSRSIRGSEVNYSTSEKECLAVVESLEHFHCIIGTSEVTVVTDNIAISTLKSERSKIKNKKLVKWQLKLAEHNVNLVYRSGKENIIADCLSRAPLVMSINLNNDLTNSTNINNNNNKNNSSSNNSNNSQLINYEVDINNERLKKEQNNDQKLKPLIQFFKNELDKSSEIGRLTKLSPFYSYHDELLYRVIIDPNTFFKKDRILKTCIVIPQSMIDEIIKIFHNSGLSGGHLGFKRTVDNISKRYYWENMYSDIKCFIDHCDPCQITKTSRYDKIKPPLKPIIAEKPFEIIAMDYVGPIGIEPTSKGNRYILVFTDLCTRWVEATATPDCKAETTAIAFYNLIITRHGSPRKLLSDLGTSFINKTFQILSQVFSIKKINTTPYHPQCDGLVERFNKTLITMIKPFTTEYHGWWDQYLEGCLFAYRMSKHSSTKFSPFFLLYGREPIIPIDISLKNKFNHKSVVIGENIGEIIKRVTTTALIIARDNNKKAKEAQSKNYNKNITNKPIYVNDQVLIKNQSKPDEFQYNKFMQTWIGPFKVTQVLSDQTIKIELPIGSLMSPLQSVKNCKKYKHRMVKLLCTNSN
ncbi:hypothetical protein ACTFIZ_004690 [Dictyostelium cf. discoideum]